MEITTHHSALSLFTTNRAYHSLMPLVREMIMTPEFAPEATAHALRKEAARLEVEEQRVAYRAACAMGRMLYGGNHPLAAVATPDELFTTNRAYHSLMPLVREMIMTPEFAP
ncbi:MAG: hypothetical protein K2J94_05560, partial [Duncaniella sp.]|nr:hypothetical protein [Duncaniella sp.]